jgi:hypothetical protein
VSFGEGVTVDSVAVDNSTQMTVNITIASEAAFGPRDVSVTNPAPGGGTATLAGAFSIGNPIPTLTGIAPTEGSRGQTLSVTFTGAGFLVGASTVSFGADITVNSVSVTSSTELIASITIGVGAATGPRDVSITNPAPGGGTASLANGFTVNISPPTSVQSDLNAIPQDYALHDAYPNPFNPFTWIEFALPHTSNVRLTIFNSLGQQVDVLVDQTLAAGTHRVAWNAAGMTSGVYFYRIQATSQSREPERAFASTKRMALLR